MSKDTMQDQVVKVLKGLKDDNPEHGFIIVTVGTQLGKDHVLTYSNMTDESVQYVAALILTAGEEAEKPTRKKNKRNLH